MDVSVGEKNQRKSRQQSGGTLTWIQGCRAWQLALPFQPDHNQVQVTFTSGSDGS